MIIKKAWLDNKTAYSPNQIDAVLDRVWQCMVYTSEGKTKYINAPISFDTESTSFYDAMGEKTGITYVWMLGICGLVIMGRTWDEWLYTVDRLVTRLRLCEHRRIIIYIHNASFDFQFLRKYHTFIRVFATDNYKPLYGITVDGLEFRCSYRLSGYSLASLAKNLNYHKIEKLSGDMDYRQMRHAETPLTAKEIQYCLNDAKVVCAYIDELILRCGDISKIPLTKTGFVREYCRNECFKQYGYKDIIHNMTLTAHDFTLCKSAFQGGFTHANSDCVNEVYENVTSMDITSSYPSVLVAEMYPIETPEQVTILSMQHYYKLAREYCLVFTIRFRNIRPKYYFDFYLSSSKCKIGGKRDIANGRVVWAEFVETTITNVDFDIISSMYQWDGNPQFVECIKFKRDYLPTPFIKALLSLYQRKTELKGVAGYEIEYAVTKENQNSYYGMTVTSPIRDIINYEYEWLDPTTPDLETAIEKYNNNYNRFLYYPWGIFCTAYARRNVWQAIRECGEDYIYCDTDSVKFLNYSSHVEFFERYNVHVLKKLECACKVHNIPLIMVAPKNKNGETKQLGAFELDGKYRRFKTLGAKRYLYQYESGEFGIVVAGMNKKTGLQYLLKQYGENGIWDAFGNGMEIPAEYSGRLVHTYIDQPREGELIDMYGNKAHYSQLSGVHLEPASYTIGDSLYEYLRFVRQMKEGDLDCQL